MQAPATDRSARPPGLSKTRFLHGLQCPKQLWWRAHEPQAPELVVGPALQRVFDRGHRVGALARTYVPGGVLIDLPHGDFEGRVAATAAALAAGAPVVYEASFLADGVFVSVDILERVPGGFVLVEAKSTCDPKPQHLPDVAIQVHVLRCAGLPVRGAEVMHLNRACRHPDLSNLFVRAPVLAALDGWLREAPARIAALHAALAGPLPERAHGAHCTAPYECPFLARCRPPLPPHHVTTLHGIHAKKAAALEAAGYVTLLDLPPDHRAGRVARRQLRSVRAGEIVVEPGLREALATLRAPIGFLDFETVGPAIPVWPGCRPYQAVPVQFSLHVVGEDGAVAQRAWLAEPGGDPRRPFAEALLAACAPARTLVAYGASFERGRLAELAEALPDLAPALGALKAKIADLLPIVRDHVYHPDFGGSFSLKSVLPALVPGLGYDDLAVQDGDAASGLLEALLLEPETITTEQRDELRRSLLEYCARDTWGLVRLHEVLSGVASQAE